jgi:competence protein ComEC
LVALVTVGIGAFVGSAGIVLYHFHRLNGLSILWTVLTFPLVWILIVLGLLKVLACLFMPALGQVFAVILEALAQVLLWLVRHIADLDLFAIHAGNLGLVPIVAYYLAIGLPSMGTWLRPRLRIGLAATFGLLFACQLVYGHLLRTFNKDLSITCLDVGHGQAVVIQAPGNRNILVDAGSLYLRNSGGRLIVLALESMGIGRLDAVLLSHMDIDHVNGLPEVLWAVKTRYLYADLDEGDASKIIRQACNQTHVPIRPLRGLSTVYPGSLDLQVIWPPSEMDLSNLADNDRSAVILIRFAGRSILLCSDIEQAAQDRLLQDWPDLRVDILLMPHHGSPKTTMPGFLDRLGPHILLCSCDQEQADRLLTEPIVSSRQVFCTGRSGALTTHIRHTGDIQVQTFLKGPSSAP